MMNKIQVHDKPNEYTAVQWDGTPDLELARWCGGSFRPGTDNAEWVLFIFPNMIAFPHDWILEPTTEEFFVVRDSEMLRKYDKKETS